MINRTSLMKTSNDTRYKVTFSRCENDDQVKQICWSAEKTDRNGGSGGMRTRADESWANEKSQTARESWGRVTCHAAGVSRTTKLLHPIDTNEFRYLRDCQYPGCPSENTRYMWGRSVYTSTHANTLNKHINVAMSQIKGYNKYDRD